MITLINCKLKLEAIGIYMEQTGSGDLLTAKLSEKTSEWSWWQYDFQNDTLYMEFYEGVEIPDLSEFGELVTDDHFMG